ncbi:MAG: class I SAM-dependent methyltransferase [Chloroflexi bacterium]|nr:class I SAM-dependent methyltransferase [Chloroflexota bacterium]
MDEHTQTNREHWNDLVPIHLRSTMYAVDAFRAGASTLQPLELAEVGPVAGKTLLHVQCHFGLDTLSWARRGAVVTGADFSDQAITAARSLSAELALPARFVCSPVNDLPGALAGTFDIVYSTYGVLCWLGDLERWAQVIAHFVAPGGVFYLADGHPAANALEDVDGEPRLRHPYFSTGAPDAYEVDGSYADWTAHVEHQKAIEWTHTLGEIVSALCTAGLRLEFLHEHPFSFFQAFPSLVQAGDGTWRWPGHADRVPLLYSLRARK